MEKIQNKLKSSNVFVENQISPEMEKIIKSLKLNETEVTNNFSSLEDTINELGNCKSCKNLNNCKNHIKGYVYYPHKKESKVTFNYIACRFLKEYNISIENKNLDNILNNARMKDIDVSDKNRIKLIKWLKSFYDNYDEAKISKGLYLHGSFGSGKTFLLAALLNELKEKKSVRFEIAYWPEVLRNLKDDFSQLDNKVRYFSNIEILLIDDIGAEKVTDWSRDEILGTILQSRMNNNKTTFFTSNLTIEELEKHLSLSKDSEDVVKARRIIERIKQLTEDMPLITNNKRN